GEGGRLCEGDAGGSRTAVVIGDGDGIGAGAEHGAGRIGSGDCRGTAVRPGIGIGACATGRGSGRIAVTESVTAYVIKYRSGGGEGGRLCEGDAGGSRTAVVIGDGDGIGAGAEHGACRIGSRDGRGTAVRPGIGIRAGASGRGSGRIAVTEPVAAYVIKYRSGGG